jgi:CBS-domain-containing membrane protein
MEATRRPVHALAAADVMKRDIVVVPRQMLVWEAVCLVHEARGSEAPVVDEHGRCVGMLSPDDVIRWVEAGCPETVVGAVLICPHQVRGRLLNRDEAVICTLADGSCPFQAVQPTTGGRHTDVCTLQGVERPPFGAVPHYMTTDVVTVRPQVPLSELVLQIVNAQADRLVVLDELDRPIGIVSAREVLKGVVQSTLAAADNRAEDRP